MRKSVRFLLFLLVFSSVFVIKVSADCGDSCPGSNNAPAQNGSWDGNGNSYNSNNPNGSSHTYTDSNGDTVTYFSNPGGGHSCSPSCSGGCGSPGDGCGGTCACTECQTCATKCGQVKDCGGSCATTDEGVPSDITQVSPLGVAGSEALVIVNQVPLTWTAGDSFTDNYDVEVYDNDSGNLVWSVNSTAASTTTAALPWTKIYRWRVRPVNSTCTTEDGNWTDWQYFRTDQQPQIIGPVIKTSDNAPVVVDANSRNNICEPSFLTSSNPREINFEVTLRDGDGWQEISSATLRWNGQDYPLNLQPGSGTDRQGTVTVDFPDGNNGAETYPLQVNIVDIWGATTNFASSGRSFKVWDCKVPVSGVMYDGAAGQNCATGIGFSIPTPSRFNFLAIGFTEASPARSSVPMLASPPAVYTNNGVDQLLWGRDYWPELNSDIQGAAQIIRMTDKGDAGANKITCYVTNQLSMYHDPAGSYTVNPYSTSPKAIIDFSYITDQDPWFQVVGAGVMSQNRLETNVPVTCALNSTCKAATSINGIQADGGLLSGAVITTNSGCDLNGMCKYGETNNWYDESPILSGSDRLNYANLMSRYFGINGVGVTINGDSNMSTVLAAGIGGTGVVFVNGNFTVDIDNTVPVGNFLMIVAKGTITFNTTVANSAGIFMADNGIVAGGVSANQLMIDGVLFSDGAAPTGNIRLSRGFVIKRNNNARPAVVVNYRPDFVFNMPGKVARVLTGWKTAL